MRFMKKPSGIVIHHSLTKDSKTVSWDAIKRYHTETMGWDDIGYHYGIEYVGEEVQVLKGRSTIYAGAHTREFNNSIGICLVGNYDEQSVESDKLDALIDLTVSVLMEYPHLTPNQVYRHTEWASYKSCPGKNFPWPQFVKEVWDRWRNEA
jgi:N-acetylmuramoyl-L-alanine amidase